MSSAERPSGSNEPAARSSLWKKPRLYLTIVAVYLVASSVVMVILTRYSLSFQFDPTSPGGAGAGLAAIVWFLFLAWQFILLIIAIVSGALLMMRFKSGLYVSLASLILTWLTMPLTAFIFVGSYGEVQNQVNSILLQVSFYAPLILCSIMFIPWILARKRIQWK